MSLSKEQLGRAIQLNLGGREDQEEKIQLGMELALEEIGMIHSFPGLRDEPTDLAIVAGESSVDLPDGTLAIYGAVFVNSTSSYRVRIKTRDWVSKRYPNPTADPTGTPVYGYRHEGKFNFVPFSDGTYAIRLSLGKAPGFSATTDLPTVQYLSEAIIAFGTAYVFRSIERWKTAEFWSKRGNEVAQKAKIRDMRANGNQNTPDVSEGGVTRGDYWDNPFMDSPYRSL